jgi:lipoyl(octanoyl) transferase
MTNHTFTIREFGIEPYQPIYESMQEFTANRQADTGDEIWFVEHLPVFTLGLAGKQEHILQQTSIPVIRTDRGGQVTYHAPGQLMVYLLLDMKRSKLGIRDLVTRLEQTVVELLASYDISALAKKEAPGVYVNQKKIASIGLKIKQYRCYHGLSLNINMDLDPFKQINPCGYEGLQMTQLSDLGINKTRTEIQQDILMQLQRQF